MNRFRTPSWLLLAIAQTGLLLASSPTLSTDPAQWSGHDIYGILHNSPWSKPVKVSAASGGMGTLGSQGAGGDSNVNNTPPPTVGAMGGRRGGMSAGRSRTYGSGGANTPPATNSKSGATEVTIQWQSALVVQIANARKNDEKANIEAVKPSNEYVLAVIGLPITAVGGRAASADSEQTMTGDEEERIEQGLKTAASLVRPGHVPLTPTKVELDQGRDGRILLHFAKSDPIRLGDKSVEFRLVMGKTKLEKKFLLKDMEFGGKLEL